METKPEPGPSAAKEEEEQERRNLINQEFEKTRSTILVNSQPLPTDQFKVKVEGPRFDQDRSTIDLGNLLNAYEAIGFQATSLSQSIEIINKMRSWRLSDDDPTVERGSKEDESARIFLGFTSNLVSSGLREIISFLAKHNYVSVIVTTAGGIEEDLIKCLSPTYLTPDKTFGSVEGKKLRSLGLNRIGNLIVPNQNYCQFEDWILPIFDQMKLEQDQSNAKWSPSKVVERLGHEINHPDSFLYWAAKNKIPVFCPALTDGSLGDMLCFHSIKTDPNPLVIDIVADIRRINELGRSAKKAGMVILGGGVCKHQIANAMLYRNGAEYSVYVNTGQEFDGSDSGARPDEAISWGKIKGDSESVKVFADATLVFPLIVAATWAKDHWKSKPETETTEPVESKK
ncbi:Deoxyhypusine synthase [Puccinia graminis f. sp. tritici]|uniref:deoxyhypusine synthase n=1 Tax=Puccinia graminis f. sp. tritici TaxID=56615 RepID=A0A5B0QU44_PUCGR|nr:Deoxyhypusine synthase [Puccinia graminis f. sp. tritici]KAA1116811.1 Deoxyhypusine synthase [Puccinia graminis f. sp. tritici]